MKTPLLIAAALACFGLMSAAQQGGSSPSGKEYRETKNRLINVTAKCKAADEAYEDIRKSSAESGHIPHPRITTAYKRMKAALDAANSELDDGKLEDARESLNIAEASATVVLRAAGGG